MPNASAAGTHDYVARWSRTQARFRQAMALSGRRRFPDAGHGKIAMLPALRLSRPNPGPPLSLRRGHGNPERVFFLSGCRSNSSRRTPQCPKVVRADPVDGAYEIPVGHGVGGLLEFPEVFRQSRDSRRRIEDNLGTIEAQGPTGCLFRAMGVKGRSVVEQNTQASPVCRISTRRLRAKVPNTPTMKPPPSSHFCPPEG